jgi:hypothetical protein
MTRATAEVFNPASDSWTNVASMAVARSTHVSETLPDGRVLVAGGWSLPVKSCGNDGALETGTDSSQLFDPASESWSDTGSLNDRRGATPEAQLVNGRVLVAGGRIEAPGIGTARTAKAEIYDLSSGSWQAAGSLSLPRSGNVVVGLADGRALTAGGATTPGGPTTTAEIYTP